MTRARDLSRLGNSQALTVDTNLNVGINSTAPVSKLNVVGIVSATSFYGDGSGLVGIANTANIVSTAITTGTLNVGTGITINSSGVNVTGVVTATSFVGSGANLTNLNIPAGFNELDAALFN
jgi:hypothetical protein